MASVTITLEDTPTGGVSVHSDFKPAIGKPCSQAQATALDIINRTRKHYGLALVPMVGVNVVVSHIDNVVEAGK